jgi:hypothetical protein
MTDAAPRKAGADARDSTARIHRVNVQLQALRIPPNHAFPLTGVAWKLSVIFWNVLETNASALSKASSCLLDSMKESRVIFQLVIEPVVFVLEPDQHRRRLSVPRNDNAVLLSEAEVLRELILDV